MFGLDGLRLKDEIIAFLSFFLDLGVIFVVLHRDYFLLSGQGLLRLYLQFHVVVKKVFILAVVTYTLKLLIKSTSFSEMLVAGLHIAKATLYKK